MNKQINKFIVGRVFSAIVVLFFSGCNSMYFKVDKSRPLEKVKINYTEIYQFETLRKLNINFIRNGRAIAISSSESTRFIDLQKNSLIKQIKSPDELIDDANSDEKGDRYVLLMDGDAQVFNTWSWALINRIGTGRSTGSVIISKDGTLLYHGDSLWNVDTGEKVVDYVGGMPRAGYVFSDNGRYFIQAAPIDSPNLIDINAGERLDTYTLSYIEGARRALFRDNTSYYIDYGTLGLPYAETLGLFNVASERLAQITPYKPISCWTRLKKDKRLIMSLMDGDVLVLDEKLKVLDHWSIGSRALKCVGGENGRAWLATKSKGLFELDINKKTISNPVQFEGEITDLRVSADGKYIALVDNTIGVDDIPGYKIMAKVYLNHGGAME